MHSRMAPCIISRVHIDASAPTRIDLAGGTLDIWPLYLFHDGAQTLNAAISLRARCCDPARAPIAGSSSSRRTPASASRSSTGRELRDNHELRLLGRLLHYFQAEGLELTHAVGVAGRRRHRRIVGAQHRRLRRARTPGPAARCSADEMLQIAMNVEAQAIDVPTGVQDYRPALYGGISAVELGVDGVRRVALAGRAGGAAAAPGARLHQRVPQLRHQQLGRHQAAHRRRPRRAAPLRADPRHRRRDARGARAAATGRRSAGRSPRSGTTASGWRPASRRRRSTPCSRAAAAAGAIGGKVCGAGGGGCLFCFGEPADDSRHPRGAGRRRRAACSTSRSRRMDCAIDSRVAS